MISLSGKSSDNINHFRGLSSDVTANKHLPNANGIMACTGTKLSNGDELAIMDGSQDVYLFDEENMVWIKQ